MSDSGIRYLDEDLCTEQMVFNQLLFNLVEQTRLVTIADLANGKTVDTLIRNTAEELGEFCAAVAVEDGYKQKDLKESAKIEAVDTTICALSLFFGRGGTMQELVEIFARKLPKWEARVKSQTPPEVYTTRYDDDDRYRR